MENSIKVDDLGVPLFQETPRKTHSITMAESGEKRDETTLRPNRSGVSNRLACTFQAMDQHRCSALAQRIG